MTHTKTNTNRPEASLAAVAFMDSLTPYRRRPGGRAAVSDLAKCATSSDPMTQVVMHKYVSGFAPDWASESELRAYYFVAALWGAYDLPYVAGVDLGGAAAYATAQRLKGRRNAADIERSFSALLESAREDIMSHLNEVLCAIAKDNAGLDWALLIDDLGAWDRPSLVIQNRWSRRFWRSVNKQAGDETDNNDDGSEPTS